MRYCKVCARMQVWSVDPPISLAFRDITITLLTAIGVSITVCRLFSTSLPRLARARLAPARTTHTRCTMWCHAVYFTYLDDLVYGYGTLLYMDIHFRYC